MKANELALIALAMSNSAHEAVEAVIAITHPSALREAAIAIIEG